MGRRIHRGYFRLIFYTLAGLVLLVVVELTSWLEALADNPVLVGGGTY